MRRTTLALCGALLLTSGLLATHAKHTVASTVPGYSENQVKAAFITHLFNFIEWPTETTHYVLCATQTSSLVATVSELVKAKPALGLSVRLLANTEVTQDVCHAVIVEGEFAEGLEANELNATVSASRGVLTIGDTPGFAKHGGMIELERRPSRIGLVVNLPATQKAGFQVSSKLLRLATIVQEGGA